MDNQGLFNKPKQELQESKVTAPPPPPIRIRTMKSDIKAVQQGGGEAFWIEAGQDLETGTETKKESLQKKEPPAAEELVFAPTSIISKISKPSPPAAEQPKPAVKKFLIILGIIVVAGFGFFLGYKFIYPLIAPLKEPPALPASPSLPEAPTISHQSFFVIPPDKTEKIKLATIELSAIKGALEELNRDNSPANTFKEIVFLTARRPADFHSFIREILPDLLLKTTDFFEEDFTAFLYYDENGAWPGYVAKLKPSAIIITAQTKTKQIEESMELRNFFIQSTGPADAQGFQNSGFDGKPVRELKFPKSGAVLSYGWFTRFINSKAEHFLIISTSNKGMEEAAEKLVK